MTEVLNIVIDTQEQTPWSWPSYKADCTVQKLNAADYALLEQPSAAANPFLT